MPDHDAAAADTDPRVRALQEPGAADRALRGVPILGGALDEIGAGADAALNYVSGGTIGEPYDQSLARRRQAINRSDAAHPIRNTIEAIAGGGVAARALPYVRPFQGPTAAGQTMLRTATDAALNAGLYSAGSGFTEGEGGFDARLNNAVDWGERGAVAGGIAGAVGQRLVNRAAGTPPGSIPQQAQSIGVELPTFMEGGRPTRAIAAKLGAIPYVGDDIGRSTSLARTSAEDAAERIANRVAGTGVNPQRAGEVASQAMSEWADSGARGLQDRLYAPINRVMAGRTAPLTNTQTAVGELTRQQTQAASPIHQRAIAEVDEALQRPGLSFEGMTRLRTRIGTLIDDGIDVENRTARAGLQTIYGALSRDMEAAIQQHGGARAQQLWRRANAGVRAIADRRETVAKIIGRNGSAPGESVVDRIVTMAGTKSSADVSRLAQARRAAGPDAWEQISGNAIIRLGRNQSNQFSPDIFLKNYSQLSESGRRTLFGFSRDRDLATHLDALAAVSQRLQSFNRLGNPSGTGGVTALLAALGGVASGDGGATLSAALAGRGVGYLMSRPMVVRNATRYGQMLERVLRGRGGQAALSIAASQLAKSVADETGEDPKKVLQRIASEQQGIN